MAKMRHQKLDNRLTAFRSTIEHEYEIAKGKAMDEVSMKRAEDNLIESWLRCETGQERLHRLHLKDAQCAQERERHKIYYDQVENLNSQLWNNLRMEAKPTHKKWLKWLIMHSPQHASGHQQTKRRYPFLPFEKETLHHALWRTTRFIRTKPSRYMLELATTYHKALLVALFNNTDIRAPVHWQNERAPAYGLKIVRRFGFSIEKTLSWEDQKFLTVLPGRHPISQERAKLYLEAMTGRFLSDPCTHLLLGRTLLYTQVALSCAVYGRRICNVTDILGVCPTDISEYSHAPSNPIELQNSYTAKIDSQDIPMSGTLATMLLDCADLRAKNRPLLEIDRSTIEGHLLSISEELRYNHAIDPVTPETFLEYPHQFGPDIRYCPNQL